MISDTGRKRESERVQKRNNNCFKNPIFFLEGGDVIQRKLTKKLLQTHNIYIQKNIFFPIMLAGKEISPLPPE